MTERALTDYARLLERLEAEAELLLATAEGADADFEVPGCPGLTLGDTVRHLGSMYRMVLSWLRSGERPTSWQREPDEGQPLDEYVLAGLRAMVDHLGAHDPEESCPTWWPEHESYGFWCRRLAHEATVHRIDVQGAAGVDLLRVPEDIAVDGVDEILSLWFGHKLNVLGVSGTRNCRVLVGTGGREWIARCTPRSTSAWRVTTEELLDASITGEPHDMYLWLWGRVPTHSREITREGSDDAIAQLWALLRLATR